MRPWMRGSVPRRNHRGGGWPGASGQRLAHGRGKRNPGGRGPRSARGAGSAAPGGAGGAPSMAVIYLVKVHESPSREARASKDIWYPRKARPHARCRWTRFTGVNTAGVGTQGIHRGFGGPVHRKWAITSALALSSALATAEIPASIAASSRSTSV